MSALLQLSLHSSCTGTRQDTASPGKGAAGLEKGNAA